MSRQAAQASAGNKGSAAAFVATQPEPAGDPSFIDRHGHPWVAFSTCILAWASVFVSAYLKAAVHPLRDLDLGSLVAAAGFLTANAAVYAAGAAWVKATQATDEGSVT